MTIWLLFIGEASSSTLVEGLASHGSENITNIIEFKEF
jgi:hypothetical protein